MARLTSECRKGVFSEVCDVYQIDYLYDDGGNRLEKIDSLGFRKTVYHYDLEDPAVYASKNNRLMYYEEFDTSGTSDVLLSTTYYYYSRHGNPTRIVTATADPAAGEPDFMATRFAYAPNGQIVTYVAGEQWDADGPDQDNCPDNYAMTYAREFRYDSARARYLVRKLDVTQLASGVYAFDANEDVWSDYDGDDIYSDFGVTSGPSPVVTNLRSFEPGLGMVDPFASTGNLNTKYYHGDQIGTNRATSSDVGIGTAEVVYTAFGEPFSGTPASRYGYAGAWGYQAAESQTPADPYVTDFKFLHVGARYYDPTTGRFLQRDPIGIRGGRNVYEYVGNGPLRGVDPNGLFTVDGVEMPDPAGPGSHYDKRQKYYRKRMRHWGWGNCTWVTFLAPWNWWTFTEHTVRAHNDAMVFYPDPPWPPQPPPRPQFEQTIPPNYCIRNCHRAG